MGINPLSKKTFGMAASFVAVISILLVSTVPVLAKQISTSSSTTTLDDKLQSEFRNDQDLLSRQQGQVSQLTGQLDRLEKSYQVDLGLGKTLGQAGAELTLSNSDISHAASLDAAAEVIVSSHNGFDSKGQVMDSSAAQQTIANAKAELRDAQNFITRATQELSLVRVVQ